MLRDLIEYLHHPYPWHLAPMGYVREVIMTGQRDRDTGGAWAPHLDATRRVIEDSARLCNHRRRAVVVGAGNLLDVPFDFLTAAFDEVVLIDIFHPKEIRAMARARGNVVLMPRDVTGVSRAVFDAARRRRVADLPKSRPPDLRLCPVDLIVSVNILSQLAVIPSAYLVGHCPGLGAKPLADFARDLIETHMRWLCQTGAQVCLVTDVTRNEVFTSGEMYQKDIIGGVALPPADRAWDWHIAPLGHVFQGRDVVHRVQAYLDFKPSGLPGTYGRGGTTEASDKKASRMRA